MFEKCVIYAQKDLNEDYWEKKENENTAGPKIRDQKKSGRPRASLEIVVASLHRLTNIYDVRRVLEEQTNDNLRKIINKIQDETPL